MNTTQQGIVTLLRSAVTGEGLPLPADFRLCDARELIRSHSMATLVYAGALHCGNPRSDPEMQRLFGLYCKALVHSEGQLRSLDRLCAAFEEAGIDYMPLKGSCMKALYPSHELRLMGDADILIRREQYPRIEPVMEALGFAFQSESDHELVWDDGSLHVELHKHLIPSYNRGFYAYFGDGWSLAAHQGGHRHAMSVEDTFLFELTHFAKHYRDGGIGCRHVVDLWVYLRAHPELDRARLGRELEALKLGDFFRNLERLMACWFAGGPADPLTEMMTQYIFASGSWGSMDNRTIAQSVRDIGPRSRPALSRLRYALRSLFPGVMTLREKYTVLKKCPWLLPLVWLWRPFYKLLFEPRDLRRHGRSLTMITRETMDTQVAMLHAVGLDENF